MNVRELIHVYGLYKDFSEFSSLLIYLSIRKVSISPVSIADIPDIRLFFFAKIKRTDNGVFSQTADQPVGRGW